MGTLPCPLPLVAGAQPRAQEAILLPSLPGRTPQSLPGQPASSAPGTQADPGGWALGTLAPPTWICGAAAVMEEAGLSPPLGLLRPLGAAWEEGSPASLTPPWDGSPGGQSSGLPVVPFGQSCRNAWWGGLSIFTSLWSSRGPPPPPQQASPPVLSTLRLQGSGPGKYAPCASAHAAVTRPGRKPWAGPQCSGAPKAHGTCWSVKRPASQRKGQEGGGHLRMSHHTASSNCLVAWGNDIRGPSGVQTVHTEGFRLPER